MGIFGIINAYGNAVIPQIGWLYNLPVTALKYIPQYILDSIPTVYPLYGFYTNIVAFLNRLIDVGINLPAIGGYIDSILSITFMQLLLPITILGVIMIVLLVKLIKIVLDIIPL